MTGPTTAQLAPAINLSYAMLGHSNPASAIAQNIATFNVPVEGEQIAANLSLPEREYYKRHIIVTLGAVFVRTITDTYTASESLLKKAISVRSETLAASETRLIKAIKALADTRTVSDSLSRILIHVRTLSDTLSKSETLLKKAIKVRTDTGSLTESITKRVTHSIQDTLGKSETLASAIRKVRTLSDTLTNSESLIKQAIKLKSDTLGKSESLTKIATKIRAISDTYGQTETLIKKSTKIIQETYGKSESLSKIRTAVRTASDSYIKSESLHAIYRKLVVETYNNTEQLRKLTIKLLSDTRSASDSVTGSKVSGTITRALSDTYGKAESLQKIAVKGLSDVYSRSESLYKTSRSYVADTLGASESIQRLARFTRSIVDTAGFNEQLVKSSRKLITDTLGVSESLDSTRIRENIVRTLTDTYTAAELIGKIVIYHITDVIGGGGGFKQFIHQIVDTYYSSEIIQSFITRGITPGASIMTQAKGLEIAKNVRIAWQRRQVKQPPPIPRLQLQRPKLVLKTLSDSYVATESIQVKVIKPQATASIGNSSVVQLPSAQVIKETIIKTLGPEVANQYVQKVIAKEREDKKLMVQQAIVEKIKLIKAQGNPDSRSLKLQKLLKLMKLNKLLQLVLLHKSGLEVGGGDGDTS
jgi:hypothetical protein